MQNENMKTL